MSPLLKNNPQERSSPTNLSIEEGSIDSSNVDEESISHLQEEHLSQQTSNRDWRKLLYLSFSSLGAIYGDIGTSPLYALSSMKFKHPIPTEKDIYGGVSIIFYIFTFIVILKYACIVLFIGPNEGQGGQIAIYAKIARHLSVGPKGVHIPGAAQESDMELLSRTETASSLLTSMSKASAKDWRYNEKLIKALSRFMLFLCFVGCALVMSDGLLTPTTSVLSSIGGIQTAKPSFHETLLVSEMVILFLFAIQRFGSGKLSMAFAPIIFLWLLALFMCGIYNIVVYHPGIFKALSPYYAINTLKQEGIDVIGAGMLAITGTEAMFADIGHFGRAPVQLTLGFFVYPCLIISYLGEGAYAVKHPKDFSNIFFTSLPGGQGSWCYWVVFVLSTLATIIASQALILGVSSILSQLVNLDCFPRLKIIHMSKAHFGKVYIPFANWVLMIGVVLSTVGFKNSNAVTAAYGLGISLDFFITSCFMILCFIYVLKINILYSVAYTFIFLPLEIIMIIANIKKVKHGAWFPLVVATIVVCFLCFWRWGRSKKVDNEYKMRIRLSTIFPAYDKRLAEEETVFQLGSRDNENSEPHGRGHYLEDLVANTAFGVSKLVRHRGVGMLFEESSLDFLNSPNTLPSIYYRLVSSFSSLPSIMVFCTIRILSIPETPEDERILISPMKLPSHYRCIIRFGFKEEVKISSSLKDQMLSSLARHEKYNYRGRQLMSLPILHIFEMNSIRSHTFRRDDKSFASLCTIILYFFRSTAIKYIFAPLSSLTSQRDSILGDFEEEDEFKEKIFTGGIIRI